MNACEQTKGLSVLQHGASVWEYFEDLHGHLKYGKPLKYEWRLPEWIHAPWLMENLLPIKIIREYLVYHDCGKPFCRTVDEDGRHHFPDHARISEETWNSVGGHPVAARLMGMDMDIHLLKGDGVPEFAARPEAATLLMAGLAEVHSNANMFGGIESQSFKMKWKQINRRGKRIVGKNSK